MKLEGRKRIASAIHQALVEIYTLNEAGLSLSIPRNRLETFYTQQLNQIAFSKTEEGTVVPSFASEQLRQETLDLVTKGQSPAEETETIEPGEIEDGCVPEFSSDKAEDLEDQNKEAQLMETEDPTEDTLEIPEEDFSTASGDNDSDIDTASQKRNQGEIHWLNVSFHDLNIKFAVFIQVQ